MAEPKKRAKLRRWSPATIQATARIDQDSDPQRAVDRAAPAMRELLKAGEDQAATNEQGEEG